MHVVWQAEVVLGDVTLLLLWRWREECLGLLGCIDHQLVVRVCLIHRDDRNLRLAQLDGSLVHATVLASFLQVGVGRGMHVP
jgi:hypothetical protein